MRFIVVDGLDGAGKDTHANLIMERYAAEGKKVIVRSHPEDDNKYGRRAKKALLGKGKKNHLEASIYYALDVIRSIRKYYGKADTFIVVRYLVGVAYLPFPIAKILYKFFETFLPTSDYMFFLDAEPEESLSRIQKRKDREMFENLEGLKKVREKALKLVSGWHIINTDRPIEEAH
ncbi:MAG: thymidylate kinase [Candidatus Thermoplasmatota archaeon]|nr:thymidylate kinase [Candidatus Thermoplasmatota archaeon]